MEILPQNNYEHYKYSLKHVLALGEQLTLGFVLTAFSFCSLIPSQALAFSQPFDVSNETITFVIPYGIIRASVMGERPTLPSTLTLKPGMHISVLAAAYSSTVSQTDADPFTTASGTRVSVGTVASNFLPLGTVVSFNGKQYTILDRMNTRYNDKYMIDVWQPSTAAAFGFGLRLVTIEIVSLPQ